MPTLRFLSPLTAAVVSLAAMSASATTFTFSTQLSSAGEPVPTSSATGSALVTLDDVLDTVAVSLSFQGLASSLPFGHIHCCTTNPGVGSVGVAVDFSAFTQSTSGSYSRTFTLGASAFDTLLAGVSSGRAYVNIHTPGLYGAGEIRGFLAPVPEPGTYALMLAGLGLVGFAATRRARR